MITNFKKFVEKLNEEVFVGPEGGADFDLNLGDEKFKYSITYQVITPESAEAGDFDDQGFEHENEIDTLEDIVRIAKHNYGISSNTASDGSNDSWQSVDPDRNFQTGSETFYSLHIKNEDGSLLSKDQIKFIDEYIKEYR